MSQKSNSKSNLLARIEKLELMQECFEFQLEELKTFTAKNLEATHETLQFLISVSERVKTFECVATRSKPVATIETRGNCRIIDFQSI